MSQLRIVLVEPIYEVNIGHVARAMKNFGFRELIVVSPRVPVNKSAIVFASHAGDILENARIVNTLDRALEGTELSVATTAQAAKSPHNLTRQSISVTEFANKFNEYPKKVAIIFGRESTGLTNYEISRCEMVVTIPAHPRYSTLNVSHAVAVILYELYKLRAGVVHQGRPRFDRESLKLLYSNFSRTLNSLGLPLHRSRITIETFEKVISRGLIASRELTLLLGAFRRIEKEIAAQRLNKQRGGYARKAKR